VHHPEHPPFQVFNPLPTQIPKEAFALKNIIKTLHSFLTENIMENEKIIRKWREVDHPGQILTALLSIKDDIKQLNKRHKRICCIGLMTGAVELPFVFRYLYSSPIIDKLSIAHLGGISYYSTNICSNIMSQSSKEILEGAIASADKLNDVLSPGDIAIILDDNITTGRTIELARNRITAFGAEVPFCICIRYPPENRLKQSCLSGQLRTR